MGSTKSRFVITILMLLKTSEAVAQNSLVPKGQRPIEDTYLNTRIHKKTKGCKSGKNKEKSGKSKKKGKGGCDDSDMSGGAYWESFAPSLTPGASDSFIPSASPAWTFIPGDESGSFANPPSSAPTSAPLPVYPPNAVNEESSPRPWSSPTGSVGTSQPAPTYGNANPTASPIHPPTTGVEDSSQSRPTPGSPVEPPTGNPVTSMNPLGDLDQPTMAFAPEPTHEASEPSPTPEGADPPGLMHDSGAGAPAPSSYTDSGTPGATEPSPTEADILTEQAGSGDDTGLLSACANHPPETSANTEIRVLAFEYAMLVVPETTFLYIESIVHEVEDRLHEVLAKELLQCEFSDDASVQRLGGEQDEFDFLSISSLPKDFLTSDDCANDEKRDNTDCLVIAGVFTVELLKGGSFEDLVYGLTRLMKEFMPPNVRRELAENLSVADIDPNLKGLVFRSFIAPLDDTAGVDDGSEQTDDDGSSKARRAVAGAAIIGTAAALAIVVGFLSTQRRRRRRSLYKDSETTTVGIQPRPSDSFSTHSSVLPILYDPHESGSYDMSVFTTTGLEPSECDGSENGNNDYEMYDMSVYITTGLEPSEYGAGENSDCEKSIPCELTSCRKVLFSQNSIELDPEVVWRQP